MTGSLSAAGTQTAIDNMISYMATRECHSATAGVILIKGDYIVVEKTMSGIDYLRHRGYQVAVDLDELADQIEEEMSGIISMRLGVMVSEFMHKETTK